MLNYLKTALSEEYNQVVFAAPLGLVCGINLSLIIAGIHYWIVDLEFSKSTIGLYSILVFPYGMKFLWVPMFNYLNPPFLKSYFGSRKAWMAISILTYGSAMMYLSYISPTHKFFFPIACFASLAAASFDAMSVAYNVEVLNPTNYSISSAAYRFGIVCGSSGILALSNIYSWSALYLIFSIIVLSISSITLLLSPRSHDNYRTSNLYDTFIVPYVSFFQKHQSNALFLITYLAIYKMRERLITPMLTIFLYEHSITTKAGFTAWKLTATAVGIVSAGFAGVIVKRFQFKKSILFAAMIETMFILSLLLRNYNFVGKYLICAMFLIDKSMHGFVTTAIFNYQMLFCEKKHASSQSALLTSIERLTVGMIASSSSGYIVEMLGWNVFLSFILLLTIPALALLYALPKEETIRQT